MERGTSPQVRRDWPSVEVASVLDLPVANLHVPPLPDMTIVLVTSGAYVIESRRATGWQRGVMLPGRFAVTPPDREIDVRWQVRHPRPLRSLHVRIGPALLEDVAASLPSGRSRAPDHLSVSDARVRDAVVRLSRARTLGAPALHADAAAISLVRHLEVEPPLESSSGRGLTARQLRAVVDVMLADLAATVSLESLADAVHLSRFHFLRQFAVATGSTPMRMLTDIRMAHAEALVREGRSDIIDIAVAMGYASASAFGAAFRRAHGVSPKAYRLGAR